MANVHCDTARATLRDVPLDTPILEENRPTPEFWAAICHYAHCPYCRPMGLAEIRGQPMYCEEAIVTAVAGKDLLYDTGNRTCTTLKEVVAHEHIYGITALMEVGDGLVPCRPKSVLEGLVDPGIDTHPCSDKVCRSVRRIWVDAPLSAHYDGDDEEAHGIEQTLVIAQNAGWNIDRIVQAAPIEKLGRFQQLPFPV